MEKHPQKKNRIYKTRTCKYEKNSGVYLKNEKQRIKI